MAGPVTDRLQRHALHLHRLWQGVALAGQRVGVAGLLIPPDNVLVGGLDEQQLIVQVHLPQAVERLEQLVKGLPTANVRHQRHAAVFPRPGPGHAQPGKAGDEGHGHIVHAVKAQVLQKRRSGALPRPGHAGNNNKFHPFAPFIHTAGNTKPLRRFYYFSI